MAKWMKPAEERPRCDIGDRVVGIVRYRENVLSQKATDMTDNKATTAEPRRQFAAGDRVQIRTGHRRGQNATVQLCSTSCTLYTVLVDGEKDELGYFARELRRA